MTRPRSSPHTLYAPMPRRQRPWRINWPLVLCTVFVLGVSLGMVELTNRLIVMRGGMP